MPHRMADLTPRARNWRKAMCRTRTVQPWFLSTRNEPRPFKRVSSSGAAQSWGTSVSARSRSASHSGRSAQAAGRNCPTHAADERQWCAYARTVGSAYVWCIWRRTLPIPTKWLTISSFPLELIIVVSPVPNYGEDMAWARRRISTGHPPRAKKVCVVSPQQNNCISPSCPHWVKSGQTIATQRLSALCHERTNATQHDRFLARKSERPLRAARRL